MKPFIANSIAPIIAIDFDGTICIGDGYPDPHNGKLRSFTKEIMNFMYDVGIKVVIWTNRKNIPNTDVKDKLLMKQWLDEMGIKYHTVNDSTEFAPFKYYGRKLYAHMFVDDRGYGFSRNDNNIMVKVLESFLIDIVGCSYYTSIRVAHCICRGEQPLGEDVEYVKDQIRNWNT
jgi:hypothetical protein